MNPSVRKCNMMGDDDRTRPITRTRSKQLQRGETEQTTENTGYQKQMDASVIMSGASEGVSEKREETVDCGEN